MSDITFSLDKLWDHFIRVLPTYTDSHYNDIMVYAGGIASLLIMLLFKDRIKKFNKDMVQHKFSYNLSERKPVILKPIMVYRWCNLLIALFASLLSLFWFTFVACLSERISSHSEWIIIAPLVPIAIYTLFEMWKSGILGFVISMIVMLFIERYNYFYCIRFASHHKACYAVRLVMKVFGVMGIVFQILPPYKDVLNLIKEKRSGKEH